MRPLVKYWRSKAIRIVVYLDDGISAATNFSNCQRNSLLVRSDLFKSGFVANKDKCQWVPLQVICWLGICWDFKNNCMFIPPDRISGILEEVVEIMSCCSISARKLARVTGRIISNFLIMGDVCKLKLFIAKSKTDIYSCFVGKTGHITCPYNLLNSYIQAAGIDFSSTLMFQFSLATFRKI